MRAVNNKTDEGLSDSEGGELLLTGGEVEVWGRGVCEATDDRWCVNRALRCWAGNERPVEMLSGAKEEKTAHPDRWWLCQSAGPEENKHQ